MNHDELQRLIDLMKKNRVLAYKDERVSVQLDQSAFILGRASLAEEASPRPSAATSNAKGVVDPLAGDDPDLYAAAG